MADEEDFESDKKTGKGPLSFFAVVDSSESDSESESEEEEVVKTSGVSKAAESKQLSPVSKLPSPQTLFATVGRPAFLDTAKEQATNIDWNSLSKRYETSFQSQVEYSTPPAPVSLTSVAEDEYDEGVFSSAPVKYKKQPTDIQKHMIVHQKRAADIRVLDLQAPDAKSEAKKMKVESFQQKEKRKRDLGQASREKSYVEEEKRILRQAFSAE